MNYYVPFLMCKNIRANKGGKITVKVNATNADKFKFYLDDELLYVDEEHPYE